MSFWKHRQQMGIAALIMGGSIFLSRFMGLIRDKIISFLFGATRESDLYFAAFVIPDFINYLLAGAYFSITLIPLLADYFEKNEQDGWRFFSAVFTWVGIAISSITALAMILAPELARLAAPGLDSESLVRLAFFLRIILPAQVCFLLGSCLTALLYLRKQFFVPALTPLIYNLFIIAGGVLLRDRGMEGFCWGVLAGALTGNLILPYLAVRRGDGLQLQPVLFHSGLKRFLYMALPLMIGQSIVVLDEQLVRIFGSLAGEGVVSRLNYARRIMLVPVGVVAQAAGVASYPFLAELSAKKAFSKLHETLHSALRNVLTLLIPLSVWMMTVSEPTITLIFQQGRFGAEDTGQTSFLLRIMLITVFCWGFQQIVGRAFYARQDTLTPAVIGTITTVLSVPLYICLTTRCGAVGVAAASSISIALYTLALTLWWRQRAGAESFKGLPADAFKLAALSILAAVPAFAAVHTAPFSPPHHPYLWSLWTIAASGICFGTVFLFLSKIFLKDLMRPFAVKAGPLGRWFTS
jgi:putative peptidoglycan lipid II flippase